MAWTQGVETKCENLQTDKMDSFKTQNESRWDGACCHHSTLKDDAGRLPGVEGWPRLCGKFKASPNHIARACLKTHARRYAPTPIRYSVRTPAAREAEAWAV